MQTSILQRHSCVQNSYAGKLYPSYSLVVQRSLLTQRSQRQVQEASEYKERTFCGSENPIFKNSGSLYLPLKALFSFAWNLLLDSRMKCSLFLLVSKLWAVHLHLPSEHSVR